MATILQDEISPDKLVATLKQVVTYFVDEEFDALERMTSGKNVSAATLRHEFDAWPATFIEPPAWNVECLVNGRVRRVGDRTPAVWLVDILLWTDKEGQSDLTLSVALTDNRDELYGVEITGVDVL